MRNISKHILLTLTISTLILMAIVGVSYLLVEYKTARYESEFKNVNRNTTWSGEISYIKVFKYTDKSAKVFIVEWYNNPPTQKNNTYRNGSYYNYSRQNKTSEWVLVDWKTVWSEEGSADDWTWPPYF